MKIKNKGKVYPSPSSSSSSSSSLCPNEGDVFSVLKLLPATILALASVLSLEDREVLAYMITRSLKTSPTTTSSLSQESKKKSSKKSSNPSNTHKPPVFDCDSFDCYTSYWFRWDTSPNRELIHQVIEAFEDHLTHGEKSKKNGGRGKKREKMSHLENQELFNGSHTQPDVPSPEKDIVTIPSPEKDIVTIPSPEKDIVTMHSPEKDILTMHSPEKDIVTTPSPGKDIVRMPSLERSDGVDVNDEKEEENQLEEAAEKSEDTTVVVRTTEVCNHGGLARKVLPDVLGLLNSRLWGLWSPNV